MPEQVEKDLVYYKKLIFLRDESNELVKILKQPILDYLAKCKNDLVPIDNSLSIIFTAVAKFYEQILATLALFDIKMIEGVMQNEITEAEEIVNLEKEYGQPGDCGGKEERRKQIENGPNSTGSNPSFSSSSDFRSGQI